MEKIWLKNYEKNIAHDINPDEYSSITALLEESFKTFAQRPCFTNFGTTLTYAEIRKQSLAFAAYLQKELKHQPGDRIALMMPNVLQYPICLFGALAAGLVVVNVNPLYTPRELQYQLKDAGVRTIVIFENAAKNLQEALPGTDVENILLTEVGDLLKFPKNYLINFVLKRVKKMVPAFQLPTAKRLVSVLGQFSDSDFKPVAIKNTDLAFLQYTGGTTGVSKGAMLTHRNMIANLLQARAWLGDRVKDGQEVIITALPLYHIFSLTANAFTFSYLGGHNILITNPKDIKGFIKELSRWPFSVVTGVNTLFRALLNHPSFKDLDFSHLKITLGGGMAVQKATAEEWKRITGGPLIEAYGLTETSPAACINPMNLENYNGSIGLPISSTSIKIINDQNEEVALGESGEIAIKGPQVMLGYWNKPEETAKVMTPDGYFKSGDIGFINEQGFVKLMDRKKDMILVSGFNVYPNEIEDVISSYWKVLEVAAVGQPDEHSGEVVKVFIVKKDPTLTAEELIEFCRKNLVSYKIPKNVEFRESLPKSNVGKIIRKDLKHVA